MYGSSLCDMSEIRSHMYAGASTILSSPTSQSRPAAARCDYTDYLVAVIYGWGDMGWLSSSGLY